ncbi:hypothetical protein LAG90_10245 [Marinilongibacter aquaticus]|uniref:hypothetical protein n=1 Tax=Marinilongibacter aquaticus TaxID=2975157 RepID=UPI0021BD40E8|nr:hypothetical protein [Marinilongibacter aquaticus]UBM57200.1 hypothetical protein LAG90_10245 [Marinilongibacter aquaticus]
MRKIAFTFIALLFTGMAFAQNAAYEKAMKSIVDDIHGTTPGQASFIPLANKMARIAEAETDEWLPSYWLAYCYTMESFTVTGADEKDQLLEQAKTYLDKAEKLNPESDEIEVMKANWASAMLTVDPMNRWQTYGPKFSTALTKAESLNSENPRVYYLKGTNLFYTPENYGGGKKKAEAQFELALEKFNKFVAPSDIDPNWGKEAAAYFLSLCQQ